MFRGKTENARFLIVALAFGWGLNWVASRIILEWLPPWMTRSLSIGLGAAILVFSALCARKRLTLSKQQVAHVTVAASLNIFIFNVCSAYAQIFGTTGRAVVIAYSMPIWAAFLARFTLRESLDRLQFLALGLCLTGLATLIVPQVRLGFPLGALFALGCAWAWAGGTVYLKWAKIEADALVVTAWQLLIGFSALAVGMFVAEGLPQLNHLPLKVYGWIAYSGLIGLGLCYFLWFVVVDRLSAITASLGTLLVPMTGVVAALLVLGEIPTPNDVIGFGLIFAAAVCVLMRTEPKTHAVAIEIPE
jgi:drug/metabolite transporter (DMT)-like permease